MQDTEFIKFAEERIDNYFEINLDQTDACVRWEAFKVYIRGEMISYTNFKFKQRRIEMETIENEIRILEQDLYNDYNQSKVKELQIMRAKYNKLSIDKVAKSLLWLKQSYYNHGEKCGKLLAWRLKKIRQGN